MAANSIAWAGETKAESREGVIPWYSWCSALAVTSVMIGGHWDISWHRSIGRDTFWTPAHMAIYLCGVLAAVAFGYLILATTFSRNSPLRSVSVRIWGLRGPLGAFIGAWGGVTMLTSAPFDNWWHDAYGLDVRIVSPPHIVLFIGIYGVVLGAVLVVAAHANRVAEQAARPLRLLYLYVSSMGFVLSMMLLMEYTGRTRLHSSIAYIVCATLPLFILAVSWRASGMRFASTIVTASYSLVLIGFILILPLFPAEPKLGPVFHPVTQFIPPEFPMLLVVPALLLDLFWQKSVQWNRWLVSVASAAMFVLSLLAVEWPFAVFLQSPAARNAFFGTVYMSYGTSPESYAARYLFYAPETALQFWEGILIAIVLGTCVVRLGISRGEAARRVQR